MLESAREAIEMGGIVGLPTDTVYGLAIDPLNSGAVRALFEAKGRPENRPVGLLVATVEDARTIADLEGFAGELGERFWPGALTLVVPPLVVLSDWVGDRQRRTIGIRVPDHPVALEFLAATGPLAVTSANRSGEAEVMDDVAARAIFADEVAVYIPGKASGGTASTVVDATGYKPIVLRQGPIDITT